MEKTIPPNAPRRVTVISKAPVYADDSRTRYADSPKWEKVAIALDGAFVDWADAPVEQDGDMLLVNGLPYRKEYQRESKRHDGWDYISDTYRLQIGWRVFYEYATEQGRQMLPALSSPHPTETFDEAAQDTRKTVTHYLTTSRSRLVTEIRWQHGSEFGEPVARLDGHNYTRQEAAAAFLSGEWLPFDWDKHETGDAATPPASESPPAEEEPAKDDTTDAGSGQDGKGPPPTIVLTVRYQGTGQAVIPTGEYLGATCKLTGYADGRHDRPPDTNVARLRFWLKERGYEPSFPEWKWYDKGHGPRRRREVYRLNGTTDYDVIDRDFLRQYAKENQPPGRDLSEAERLERYREGALAGRAPWQICPDCPDLHNCPTQYQACERRQKWVKQRQRERDRPKLFVPGLIG